MNKLNLGCGTDIKEGYINLDIYAGKGVDVVHDIEKLPLPFTDSFFDEIYCKDILEHTEYIPILKDLHRILKPGGKLYIEVPHFTAKNNFEDPTHKKMFSIDTFTFFVGGHWRSYYFDFSFSSIGKKKITFRKYWFLFYNYLVAPFVNLNNRTQLFYELSFMHSFFPAANIQIELIK